MGKAEGNFFRVGREIDVAREVWRCLIRERYDASAWRFGIERPTRIVNPADENVIQTQSETNHLLPPLYLFMVQSWRDLKTYLPVWCLNRPLWRPGHHLDAIDPYAASNDAALRSNKCKVSKRRVVLMVQSQMSLSCLKIALTTLESICALLISAEKRQPTPLV